jgi:hypothetical protein
MLLVLPVDATDEVLAAGFCIVFATELVGAARVLPLDDGVEIRVDGVEAMCCCHELAFPAEILLLVLARRPCTSLSALQTR